MVHTRNAETTMVWHHAHVYRHIWAHHRFVSLNVLYILIAPAIEPVFQRNVEIHVKGHVVYTQIASLIITFRYVCVQMDFLEIHSDNAYKK